MTYKAFLERKIDIAPLSGIEIDPAEVSPVLKDHQRVSVLWALRGGRRGIFARFGLGKTIMQLEWCRLLQKHEGGQTLIVMPLNVLPEFKADAVNLLGMDEPPYCRTMAEVEASTAPIVLTNYERVRDGDIDPHHFTAVSLDEAATLRSFGSKTYQSFMQKFKGVKYKLTNTATPSPNRYKELIHYAGFLEIMDTGQSLTRFFKRDSTKANNLTLYPGRVAAIHVKDRVEFANVTGLAAPTIEPFHADCIAHFRKHGFAYFGMITVVTDVVRENNQTYRLGWTEQCKDGTKMGVGCPEYILLFRKLPTDCSRGYADTPVKKSKEEYTRAQWQIDAHAFWRSSGDRPFTREELEKIPTSKLQNVYRKFSRDTVYSYEEHVKLAESLDKDGRLPSTFMVVAPGSWDMTVWDDIVRMKTLNTSQSQRRQNLHVCPLQIDIVQRLIERYSNEGELVADPFAGLFTVPYEAVKMNRKGKGVELNPDYFRDGVGYLEAADAERDAPTLFDLLENGA